MRHFRRTACLAIIIAAMAAGAATLNRAAEQQEPAYIPIAAIATARPTQAEISRPTATPAPTPTATPEPEPEPEEPAARIYDSISLAPEIQEFAFWRCEETGLDYEMVLALIVKESSCRADVISATNDYGLMQINTVNHKRLREELGITDFLDAEQNITAGTEILAGLAAKYEDPHRVLMAYNMGEAGARRHWEKGTTTSYYSRNIMALRAEILEGGTP